MVVQNKLSIKKEGQTYVKRNVDGLSACAYEVEGGGTYVV
jgi:hypothetical protein